MEVNKINSDRRGDVFLVKSKDREFLLLEINKGFIRGGDFHNTIQYNFILEGRVREVTTKEEKILEANQGSTIEAGVPHYIEAIEDSIVLEWIDRSGDKQYYAPFRKLVEKAMNE